MKIYNITRGQTRSIKNKASELCSIDEVNLIDQKRMSVSSSAEKYSEIDEFLSDQISTLRKRNHKVYKHTIISLIERYNKQKKIAL